MADRLYLLKPNFTDKGHGPFFCAECAIVEGMLGFYPVLRERLDVRYVEFQRPRPQIVAELGEEHQSAPVLVMDQAPREVPGTVEVKQAGGRFFIDDPFQICNHLAAAHRLGAPHHPVALP